MRVVISKQVRTRRGVEYDNLTIAQQEDGSMALVSGTSVVQDKLNGEQLAAAMRGNDVFSMSIYPSPGESPDQAKQATTELATSLGFKGTIRPIGDTGGYGVRRTQPPTSPLGKILAAAKG